MDKLKRARNLYKALQKDSESVFFGSKEIKNSHIKKARRSNYAKDKFFLTLYVNINKKEKFQAEPVIPSHIPFVEKKSEIDRSTLYSFGGPFELLHADIADIRFFAKSAADPLYCLLIVDLFTQKVYTYPMKKRNLLSRKLELFYNEVKNKRKNKRTKLQTDLEFNQNEIKILNKKHNVEMFHTRVRGGKAFAAEQKIREFKKLLLKMKKIIKSDKKRLKPNDVIKKVTYNMNNTKSQKYQIEPEVVEEKSLKSVNFKDEYDFYRLNKVGQEIGRQIRHNKKKDDNNPKKLTEPLQIGEKVLVLSERLKKKDAPGRLFKATTQNKSYFSKKIFIIKKRVQTTSKEWYYWVAEENSKIVNSYRYVRQELYALNYQWR